jgi:hypothetical protein
VPIGVRKAEPGNILLLTRPAQIIISNDAGEARLSKRSL